MGVAGGVENLPWLFAGSLTGMLLLNPPFAWLVGADAAAALRLVRLPLLRAEPRPLLRRPHLGRRRRRRLDGTGPVRLDVGLQHVRRLDLLVGDGRRVLGRPGQAPVRLHRRRRHHRRHHRRRRSPRAWSACSAPPTCCWCRRRCSKWPRSSARRLFAQPRLAPADRPGPAPRPPTPSAARSGKGCGGRSRIPTC